METHAPTMTYHGEFANRADAGRRLAKALTRYHDRRPIVLALPRGGVPVGYEIAKALQAPLDLLFVRKLPAPDYPEVGIGAVVDGPQPVHFLNQHVIDGMSVSQEYIDTEMRIQLSIIEERKRSYLGGRPPLDLEGHTIILTDDGIATGASVRAGLKALAQVHALGKILAVPVAPHETLQSLAGEADDLVCLLTPADFQSVGFYYADFEQVADERVIALLQSQ